MKNPFIEPRFNAARPSSREVFAVSIIIADEQQRPRNLSGCSSSRSASRAGPAKFQPEFAGGQVHIRHPNVPAASRLPPPEKFFRALSTAPSVAVRGNNANHFTPYNFFPGPGSPSDRKSDFKPRDQPRVI
jgi:hypothetical protein